jgi:transcriptional antiterminator NusG
MVVTDESWYVVRNTPRVTGFLGAGTTPIPVSKEAMDDIMKRMEISEPEFTIDFEVGSSVKIIDGPFKGFEGKVSDIDKERGKIKVLVNMFGRDTPVELDSLQIKKVE